MTLTTVHNADTGLWTLTAPPGALGQPVVSGGTVYVPVSENGIAAVDAYNGEVRWCSDVLNQPDPEGLVAGSGTVVVPLLRRYKRVGFTVLDAKTGEVRWSGDKGGLHRAAVSGTTVVLWNDALGRGKIAGFDALTGETLWENEFKWISELLVRGDRVILDPFEGRDADRGVRALDARTGEGIWIEENSSLLGQNETDDAASFHAWTDRGGLPELTRNASDTGKALTTVLFPRRTRKPFLYSLPVLADGGHALFRSLPGQRHVRVFSYAGGTGSVSEWGRRLAW